jgi:hypothetical protein
MTTARKNDALAGKASGDEWYCYEAPEEFHIWTLAHPWPADSFREYGVALLAITVRSATLTGEESRDRYNTRNPLRLDCGVEINQGFYQMSQTKASKARMRVADPAELEDAMREWSKKTGLETWEVKELVIYNAAKGAEVEFKCHNPDGNGASLYLFRVTNDGGSRLYTHVTLHEQGELLGGFHEKLAHCTFTNALVPSCSIKKKLKPKQIKTRHKL